MKLFDDNNLTSPVSAPRNLQMRSRLFGNSLQNENRRVSAPAPATNILAHFNNSENEQRKRKRTTNINPFFTPTSLLATMRKKARMASGESNAEER